MIRIVTIIGARPQFIKAAALSRTIRRQFSKDIDEILVHTGQHYDENMSLVFFHELEIPEPAYNLNIGSASHSKQTARMMVGIEEILKKEDPDYLVVYGDTNSTLAAALVAAKMHIPIVHIEAGLRSFNKSMPEEINRIVCDHCSTLLFSPTRSGYQNLVNEGFREFSTKPFSADNPGIFHCGDVMYDNAIYFSQPDFEETGLPGSPEMKDTSFILATIHRNNNTDDVLRLTSILRAMLEIIKISGLRIVFPIHPRTKKMLDQLPDRELLVQLKLNSLFEMIPPVSFLEMMTLEKTCRMIITDSGGVQKEAYFFNKPCIIARSETEWIEIVENGCAIVADADEQRIVEAFKFFDTQPPLTFPPLFGDGNAAIFICRELINHYISTQKQC
ncbi:MAG: UDP-N-acetylglucosamine 2-epimerase (non-hydrolyzing) [Bacteroidales bacterium]|nr:UDP-N-acetylglucosamine 2-epimerase (non-hydrolyzing) [Bacteroidales bacterium]MDZ4203568.1 UDP-N-acetylglucosamine 2-epimerase (non-hydrolyzing) [Bacteroidales bacterium]